MLKICLKSTLLCDTVRTEYRAFGMLWLSTIQYLDNLFVQSCNLHKSTLSGYHDLLYYNKRSISNNGYCHTPNTPTRSKYPFSASSPLLFTWIYPTERPTHAVQCEYLLT